MKFIRGFLLAFNMLTIIPLFKQHDFFKGINGYAVMSYPIVGFLLGGLLYLLYQLSLWHVAHFYSGVIVFAFWVILTGGLHLDGLFDSIDGLFVPKQKALEVMKDSHVGGMGVVFGSTFLIVKAFALCALDAVYLLPFILMLSRYNALLSIYFYPYISKGGMASLAKDEFNQKQMLIASFVVFVVSLFYSFVLFLLSLLFWYLMARFFSKRYGGLNGDMYGFIIEMSELLLLNAILFLQ